MPSLALSNSIASREDILAAMRAADFFSAQQLARAEALLPEAMPPERVASTLIAGGLITRFQADRLQAARTDGLLLGPYILEDELGRGSMGKVYRARHRTINRAVAIKVIAKGITRPVGARTAIEREIRAAAQLNHANIVTAYDANELGERFYLVLEYVNGPNLAVRVAQRGPLPVMEACELIRQAALGLEHAHGRGMVHRDLNPKNLLVSNSKSVPRLKIADFGISRFNPNVDLDYVAPEQARHPQATDRRSNLYSLGAVLHFLLAGRPPFPGGSDEEKVRRHMWESLAPIEQLRPDVPAEVAALVRELLAKAPHSRPATAADVAARLGVITGNVEQSYLELTPAPVVADTKRELTPLTVTDTYPLVSTASETSLWAALTVPSVSGLDQETKELPRPAKGRAGSRWKTGVSLGLVAFCVVAITAIARALAK